MATTFQGATRADVQRFAPEALDTIRLATNLRHDLGDVEELARRIAADGQLQPGIVRRDSEGFPVLVAGYRRLAAIKLINATAGHFGAPDALPFLAVFRSLNEDGALVLNLRENLDRKDLSPVDLAHAAAHLEALGWERKRIADAMRCTAAHVGSLLSLLELPGSIVTMAHRGEVPVSAALAMRKLPRPKVESLAERLATGEVTPQIVIREAKAEKRAAGKRLGRTLAEVKEFLGSLSTAPAADFLSWIDGETTIEDGDVSWIFEDRQRGAA